MLDQVQLWQPPTDDHMGLKEFMIQQIEESIKFDCASYAEDRVSMIRLLSGDEWL